MFPRVILKGTMIKKSQQKKRTSPCNYKERFFVLDTQDLRYSERRPGVRLCIYRSGCMVWEFWPYGELTVILISRRKIKLRSCCFRKSLWWKVASSSPELSVWRSCVVMFPYHAIISTLFRWGPKTLLLNIVLYTANMMHDYVCKSPKMFSKIQFASTDFSWQPLPLHFRPRQWLSPEMGQSS